MPVPQKIINFLEKNKIKYEILKHRTVYTAFNKAQTLKVPQKIIGKTLILKGGKEFFLVLIPANKNLCKIKFKKIVNKKLKEESKKAVKNIDFVSEAWMKKNLKGVKVGSVPPFGNLFKLPTFIDNPLLKQTKVIVSGGDYNHSIKISANSFKKIIPDLMEGSFSKARKL